MEKIILGLDPGIAILGFGTIICHKAEQEQARMSESLRLGDCGVIETPAKVEISERLLMIYDDLHSLIEELRPDLVAIEKLFFYRMSNTITVAQARGVMLLVLGQTKIPYVEFTPPEIKQTLTGYGNADKYEVQLAVARELSLDSIPQPDDAADALAVALTAWFR